MADLTVERLLYELGDKLELVPMELAGVGVAPIVSSDVSRPGLVLAGFAEGFRDDQVQVLGKQELIYLETLSEGERRAAIARLCGRSTPCIVVAEDAPVPAELLERCTECSVPVLATPLASGRAAREIGAALDALLAPSTSIHGTLVDVYGMGLLLTGKSGIGKSECALDLVEKGHRLVADDVVRVVRTPQSSLIGVGSDIAQHCMEIRGVGIVDVRSMFGIRAIRKRKRIEVEVQLTAWSDLVDYERLGFDEKTTEILGVKVPLVTLPLVPGKNISVIAEVIALNQLLKLYGVHSARELDTRLRRSRPDEETADSMAEGDSE